MKRVATHEARCLTPTVLVGIVEDPPLCLLNLCHLIMNAQPLSCAHHSISSPFRWSFILLLCARVFLSCTHCTRVRTHTCILLLLLFLSCTRVRTAFVQGVRCLRAFALVCCVALCCVGFGWERIAVALPLLLCCVCVASVAVLASLGACHTARMAYGAARGGGGYMCAVSHILPYGAARWAVKRTGEHGQDILTHTHTHTHTHNTHTTHTHTNLLMC